MANDVKLRPDQPPRRFVSVDVTNALDTIAWGRLWNARFGWENLLWELDLDAGDKQRRVDKAHPKLPIMWLSRTHETTDASQKAVKVSFSDTCLMPQGKDGKGIDKLWPGPDKETNIADIDECCDFMQEFLLKPFADKATSELNNAGKGVGADIVYISSHGLPTGDMSGDVHAANYIFSPAKAAHGNKTISFDGWFLLSNCSTLHPCTHQYWLKLMTGTIPLRGIVGFQDTCPLAPGSVDLFSSFIDQLALGKTFIESWRRALTVHGLARRWVALCHPDAVGDTIVDWNKNNLKAIPAGSKISFFDEDNVSGAPVNPQTHTFNAFWSKGTSRIIEANRHLTPNKLAVGDIVEVSVEALAPPRTFADGTKISITPIYVRPNYPLPMDVTKMFKVTGQTGVTAITTADLNPQSTGGPDSWVMTVTGTPGIVSLTLECLDLKGRTSNYAIWLRVDITTAKNDFRCEGTILIK